ncbi:MAG: calcium/sodium antiporter [Phycisphaerae bacterium]|nr:calcium/sodium antiporter [Phycisphaerae bacterium]
MQTFLAIFLLIVGLAILWKSADILVAGAVGLAERFSVSPLIVGLTVVAFGTSAPEAAASIAAALRHTGDIAIGNVYGSNIANLALIGGICAIISPTAIHLAVLKREIPILLVATLILAPLVFGGLITRGEGVILLIAFAAFIIITIYAAAKEAKKEPRIIAQIQQDIHQEVKTQPKKTGMNVIFVIAGLIGLAVGADIAIRGAVSIGMKIGLSQAVIGMTIIALGTSLPELATSVAATIKGHDDISIGNLIGSNIFNTLMVVGAASTIRPLEISHRLAGTDYWIMAAVTAAFVAMAALGKKLSRLDGVILVTIYIAYIGYLFGFNAIVF